MKVGMNWQKYLPLFFIFSVTIFFSGCGKDSDQKRADALLSARIKLTNGDYQGAIDTLESIGRDPNSADYMSTLSSAYAGKAGFSEIKLLGSDIAQISASGTTSALGGFARFSTSANQIDPELDAKFLNLQKAIDLLLYAGNVSSSSHSNRASKFSKRDIGNLNTQMIYMITAQIGKFVNYYGNASATTGRKGLGTSFTNECFYQYTDATALTAITYLNTNPLNNICDSADPGHPDILGATAQTISRMCRGVVLFNNYIDLFINTALGTASNVTNLSNFSSTINTYINSSCQVSNAGNVNLGALCSVKDQDTCESVATISTLEVYFAAIFESLML